MARMENLFFLIFILIFDVKARPFKSPDFVSRWYFLAALPDYDHINVAHHLEEVPVLVQVQVWSRTKNNNGFIFPAVGIVPRDDDLADPRSGVVYLYDKTMVTITALSKNNDVSGRTIYTENSTYWEGPNNDGTYSCYVRVRAWKLSSFPEPDYHPVSLKIQAACDNASFIMELGTKCFYEQYHGLNEYPSMIVVRTKLVDEEKEYHGFMSDAVGSGLMVYENVNYKQNGYVTYGFDSEYVRIWTDASSVGYVFYGHDGSALETSFRYGELEILAWRFSTLTPTLEDSIQLGTLPGGSFDQDKTIKILSETEDMVVSLWAEAKDGLNSGFRFAGSGSLSYTPVQTTSPCSYGGITYAYTNTSIRIWKPGPANIGNVICIPRTFGGGKFTQGSNQADAIVHIWIPQVSTLNMNCTVDEDCFDLHSACHNTTCSCEDGFYEVDGLCEKDLACADNVPPIPSLNKRARNYVIEPDSTTDIYVNDNALKLSWYTATLSNRDYQMPDVTTIPGKNACGANHQVYVNGTHPNTKEIGETPIELQICYEDCRQTEDILIRKCGRSLQYRLKPLHLKDMAYCFDPPELKGILEFDPAPAVENFSLALTVELHFHLKDIHSFSYFEPYLTFNCTADRELPKQLFYTTYWFLGSNLFLALGPSHSIESLTEKMLDDRKQGLDVYMRCGVRISESETGFMTALSSSAEQFYGIKVQNPVVIKKGESTNVIIEPTAPIGCVYSTSPTWPGTCFHPFYPVQQANARIDIFGVQKSSTCGSKFKAYQLNDTWHGGDKYKFKITTKDNNYADGHQFRLNLQLGEEFHRIWRGHRIDGITVYVTHNEDYKYKQCYSHVDPHMQTADGYRYENQNDGEFILYRNVKYSIEVQEKTTLCNQGRAFCACAVAIRAGGDIFVINTCGGLKFIGFTSCSDGGLLDVRKHTSLRYQVYTPIGTYINIQMRPHPNYYNLMNIDVFMAPKDKGRTEGLCGYFDGIQTNDLRKRNKGHFETKNDKMNYHPDFSQEWRIKPFEHNYLVLDPQDVKTWQSEQNDIYCYCNYSGSADDVAVCSAVVYDKSVKRKSSVFMINNLCEASFRRKRRSSSNLAWKRELERRQQLVYTQTELLTKRGATEHDTITREQATKYCSDVINSQQSVKNFGHRLKSLDPQQAITECAYDVFEGNDLSWANVYPSVLNQVIEANNERDPEYVEANEDEVAQFNSQSCPFNCNGRGNCSIEGECKCSNGFHGPDCGIDEMDLLQIDDIEGGGFCHLNFDDECRCFHIQTINLLENFQCKMSETLIMVNGSQIFTNTTERTGTYTDIFNGECCVPFSRTKRSETVMDIFATEFEFSISNNGQNFGKAAKVIVFDSTCQEQIKTEDRMFIVLKNSTCFISGICRVQNETRFGDECSVCSSQHSKYDWTEVCGKSNINTQSSYTLGFVLGLCGGMIVVLISILMLCVLKHFIGKKMMTVGDMIIYRTEPPKVMEHRYRRPDLSMFNKK